MSDVVAAAVLACLTFVCSCSSTRPTTSDQEAITWLNKRPFGTFHDLGFPKNVEVPYDEWIAEGRRIPNIDAILRRLFETKVRGNGEASIIAERRWYSKHCNERGLGAMLRRGVSGRRRKGLIGVGPGD